MKIFINILIYILLLLLFTNYKYCKKLYEILEG